MLYATNHNTKANAMARRALHRAMFFDDQTDLSDAHFDEAHYISKVKNTRAWGNSSNLNGDQITLSPMSGIKDGFFYPARSARIASGNGFPQNYTATQTAKAVFERYFCMYETSVGSGSPWAAGQPVFTGQNGPSNDTSVGYYWPSPCMLVFPENVRQNATLQTYSSKSGSLYARNYDSFWGTFSGYDGGYVNGGLRLDALAELPLSPYSYISTTSTPIQNVVAPSVSNEPHVVFVRPVGKTYSYNGLNQYSTEVVPAQSIGVSGYTRSASAFGMRVSTNKEDTPDVSLESCMMAFKANGLGYLLRATVGADLVQIAPTPTDVIALLTTNYAEPFADKSLYQI